MNYVDLFVVHTEVSFPFTKKTKIDKSASACLNLFVYEFYKYFLQEEIVTPYDLKEILKFEKAAKYYSFVKFKEVLDNNIPQIYIHTGTDFDLVDLMREYRDFYRDWKNNFRIRMLDDSLSNYEALKQMIVDLYNFSYPSIKLTFTETKNKYSSTILEGDQFKTLERSSKLQMIKGINEVDLKTYFDGLKRRLSLPPSKYDDFDSVIESIQWSDSLMWYCMDMLYSVEDNGKVKYANILANRDVNKKYPCF
jgi:hypothetical protein